MLHRLNRADRSSSWPSRSPPSSRSQVPELFLTPGNLANVARQISLDAPLVFGQALVLIAGGIDISVGSTMAMAGGADHRAAGLRDAGRRGRGARLRRSASGRCNGLLVTRGGIVPFVATLGTMSVVRGLLLTYTQQQSIPITDEAFTWLGRRRSGPCPCRSSPRWRSWRCSA